MKKILLIIPMMLLYFLLHAQQPDAVVSGGDYFQNANGTLNWTLGEVVTGGYSNQAGGLNQGFQQTNILITEVEEPVGVYREVLVFPNPAKDHITVQMDNSTKWEYSLYDLSGNLIEKQQSKQPTREISFSSLKPGIYFLKINSEKKHVKTLKIEKI